MTYHSIDLIDYTQTSWALCEILKRLPEPQQKEGLAPVFYKFFPRADAKVRMKDQYRRFRCEQCGRYDSDKIFKIGFEDPVTIRFKEDYGVTNDRVFAINDKFLKVLKKEKVEGYETKPLGDSGWHALRITRRVAHSEKVIKCRKPLCPACGNPKECFGLFEYERELSLPSRANTFFTTHTGWPASHFRDRQDFITGDALEALQKNGIKGGYFTRLLTDDERKQQKAKEKEGVPFWKPPGVSVKLSGKKKAK